MKPPNNPLFRRLAACLRIAAIVLATWWTGSADAEQTNALPSQMSEALVIIVNKGNPVENLSIEELRKHFRMDLERWPDGRKNTVLMLPPSSPERDAVLKLVYDSNESGFKKHFLLGAYAGKIHSEPKELANSTNMRKFIFNVPGAIGYVRASQVDDTVKVLKIDGRLPGDAGYGLKLAAK